MIKTWLNSDHIEVRRSAMALLTRAYVLDGMVLDVPVSRYGALMIDSGRPSDNAYEEYIKACFELAQRLATMTSLRVYHLGSLGAAPLTLGLFDEADPTIGTIKSEDLDLQGMSRPLLMMPIFEPINESIKAPSAENCHFILVLNMADVLDFGDVLHEPIELYSALDDAAHENSTCYFP